MAAYVVNDHVAVFGSIELAVAQLETWLEAVEDTCDIRYIDT